MNMYESAIAIIKKKISPGYNFFYFLTLVSVAGTFDTIFLVLSVGSTISRSDANVVSSSLSRESNIEEECSSVKDLRSNRAVSFLECFLFDLNSDTTSEFEFTPDSSVILDSLSSLIQKIKH